MAMGREEMHTSGHHHLLLLRRRKEDLLDITAHVELLQALVALVEHEMRTFIKLQGLVAHLGHVALQQ